mgnify:CR=1 FL=1
MAIILSVVLAFSVFCVPVSATVQMESINIENMFNLCKVYYKYLNFQGL